MWSTSALFGWPEYSQSSRVRQIGQLYTPLSRSSWRRCLRILIHWLVPVRLVAIVSPPLLLLPASVVHGSDAGGVGTVGSRTAPPLVGLCVGAVAVIRTRNLPLTRRLLCQLSYNGVPSASGPCSPASSSRVLSSSVFRSDGRALLGREPARSCLVALAHAAFGVAGLGGVVGSVRVRRSDWGCWLVRPVASMPGVVPVLGTKKEPPFPDDSVREETSPHGLNCGTCFGWGQTLLFVPSELFHSRPDVAFVCDEYGGWFVAWCAGSGSFVCCEVSVVYPVGDVLSGDS